MDKGAVEYIEQQVVTYFAGCKRYDLCSHKLLVKTCEQLRFQNKRIDFFNVAVAMDDR